MFNRTSSVPGTRSKTEIALGRVSLTPTQKLWTLFLQVWSFSRPKGNFHYTPNRDFRVMFFAPAPESRSEALVSASRYFARWTDSYDLLRNLFYVNGRTQLLTNKFFIEEALAFNWQYSLKNYKLFRYVQPFFMLKDAVHGESIHSSIFSMFMQKLDFLIITDLKNHFTLLGYLRRYNLYSIGLIPSNYSPWKVSYPIPTFSDSQLDQYLFLRWLVSIKHSSTYERYRHSLQMWSRRHI
jgi:hypothetical protein